jgi:hypothetical protein
MSDSNGLNASMVVAGIARTLLRDVLPGLGSGFARGQLYAAIELLENLDGRVVWGGPLAEAEFEQLGELAAAVHALLAMHGADEAAVADAARMADGGGLEDRRRWLCGLIESGGADEGDLAVAVDGFLTNSSLLQAMGVKPSRLAEISQG